MKKHNYILPLILICNLHAALAQNIGVNNPTPDPSALWDMTSTDKGVLIPRMTSAQRIAIPAPATGLLVYDNSLNAFYFFNGAAWQPIGGNSGWALTGDAGTTPAVNFLGTTDNQPLVIKVDNMKAGFLDNNDGTFLGRNTFLGKSAGFSNTITGYDNTFIGAKAGSSNTIGTLNTAVGAKALQNLTTGFSNVAIGREAMQLAITGIQSTAVGMGALQNSTAGVWNNAFGYLAMRITTAAGTGNNGFGTEVLFNNTALYNSAFGHACMRANTTGNYNSAFGNSALYNNTTGGNNSAFGNFSLSANTSGTHNTALGNFSLSSNTTGGYNISLGSNNMMANTTGTYNISAGYFALQNKSTGDNNIVIGGYAASNGNNFSNVVAIGSFACSSNNASGCVAVGHQSASNFSSYNNCTLLGQFTDANASGYTNSSAIGNGAMITSSNEIKIGNTAVSSIGGYANWTNFSDGRFKKNISPGVPGLVFINELRPVTYTLDVRGIDRQLKIPDVQTEEEGISEKEGMVYSGFIAQEVEDAAKKAGYDFSGVDIPKNENDFYGIRYADFVVPLVKAVQELAAENSELRSELTRMNERLSAIEKSLELKSSSLAGKK